MLIKLGAHIIECVVVAPLAAVMLKLKLDSKILEGKTGCLQIKKALSKLI